MAPKYKFTEGERVLCFHGPILYEAKCVKIEAKDKVVKYFVHYQGWNKSWDEWVPESRVLKYNEANCAKQKEIQEAQAAAKPKGKGSRKRAGGDAKDASITTTPKTEKNGKPKTGSTPGAPTTTTPSTEVKETGEKETGGKKRRTKVDQITEDIQNLPEVKIFIPEVLRKILVEDWETINKNSKLVLVPAHKTIDDILEEYVNFKKKENSLASTRVSNIFEITNGIREYFNVVLGTKLLYKPERTQYDQVRKDGDDEIAPSSVYGFVHLVRLFIKFGNLFAHSHSDEKTIQILIPQIDDFLSYCAKNVTTYYSKDEYASSVTPESPKKS